jgi:hypothetical protein
MVSRAWARILMAVLLLAGMLVTVLPDLGQAAEPAPMTDAGQQTTLLGPFSLQAGFKTWYAQWQTRTNAGIGTSDQVTSSFAPMIGPQITLGYNRPGDGNWFRGLYASYQYLNGGFDMHLGSDPAVATTLTSALRTDTTITVSAPVYKGYGVFGGFYESLQRHEFSNPGAAGQHTGIRFKGPVAGIFGTQPIPDTRASLYGNVGVGWLTLHTATGFGQDTNLAFRTDSAMLYSMESGVNYGLPGFWKIKPSVQIGFRAQVIAQTFGRSFSGGQDTRTNDIMWGPIFMLAAAF